MRRFLPLIAFTLLCAAPIFYGASIATAQERVDVGGYSINTQSAGTGGPSVVFVSGLGEDLSTWQHVQPDVAKFAKTLVYDRAGLGKSDNAPKAKSIEQMVEELHALVAACKLARPFILVGHSLGGAIVELYASTYPDEIAGLVLVDPEDGRLLESLQAKMPPEEWEARKKLLDQMMSGASPAQKAEIEASKSSGQSLAQAKPLPDVPVVLLTGTLKDPGFPGNPLEQDLKLEQQNALLAKIPQGKHVLVPQSRHYIQDDAPNLVIDAIREVAGKTHRNGGSDTI